MAKLIQGRDYHGWAWECSRVGLHFIATGKKPDAMLNKYGRWVRVKFVVVEPKLKKKAKVRK